MPRRTLSRRSLPCHGQPLAVCHAFNAANLFLDVLPETIKSGGCKGAQKLFGCWCSKFGWNALPLAEHEIVANCRLVRAKCRCSKAPLDCCVYFEFGRGSEGKGKLLGRPASHAVDLRRDEIEVSGG